VMSHIEGVVRVARDKLNGLLAKRKATFQYDHKPYYLHYLGSLLDVQKNQFYISGRKTFPVILIPGNEYPMALLVDELLYSRELVIQSLGTQFKLFNECSGATLLGDGRVVLVLDSFSLSHKARALMKKEQSSIEFSSSQKPKASSSQKVVMVVDDSMTIRTVTKRFLERHQFSVVTAKDGLDALGQLEKNIPDIILLDIDMPRMDGFEFAVSIRSDEKYKDIPIIVITSRPSEKHKKRANEMLLEGFMEKPYQEPELLSAIEALLGGV
jgi:chemosensory pili system protein ChpA (sensor histidine kinase/response regulator)